ncbi:MAG: DUF2007 domain-containing protein [Hyphomonadaceae bacterium]
MKQVYAPANAAEAHMLAHMLGQNDIVAHIHGEALQGGVGELPASGLLQLLVADEDYERARALIAAWERANTPSSDTSSERKPPSIWMALLVIGLGVGGGWMLRTAAENNLVPIDAQQWGLDQNGDGRDDATFYARIGAAYAYKSEYDRNFDSEVDDVWHFDARGAPTTRAHDDNFDGHMESRTVFRHGNASRTEIDTDRDGEADRTLIFLNGILDREEIHPANPQTIVRVNYFDQLWMTRSESDADGDGVLETVQTYNERGDITGTETRANVTSP